MKKWLDNWPFLGAIILTLLNVDWVLVPFIKQFTDSFWDLFLIVMIVANLELLGWYIFWRWLFKDFLPKRKKIETVIEIAQELKELEKEGNLAFIIKLLKESDRLERLITKCEEVVRWATNPESWQVKKIKAWGHSGMFFLGFEPFVQGGRMAGVVFCATTGWKAGLYTLGIGNIAHVALSIWSWNIIFYFWGEYRAACYALIALLLAYAVYFFWNSKTKKI